MLTEEEEGAIRKGKGKERKTVQMLGGRTKSYHTYTNYLCAGRGYSVAIYAGLVQRQE